MGIFRIVEGDLVLIDDDGNRVIVKDGSRLAVQDERSIRTLEGILEELQAIRQILSDISDE